MFKILLISIITFILVIIIFLLFISFMNNDIKTSIKENFFVSEPTFTNGIKNNVAGSTTDVYIQFNSNGTLTLPNPITADILIVGGGGGGGSRDGGGGGAGALIYKTKYSLASGTYSITIGNGGNGGKGNYGADGSGLQYPQSYGGQTGNDTIITNLSSTVIFRAKGGGGGGEPGQIGKVGGCNGGNSAATTSAQSTISALNIPQDSDVFGNIGGVSVSNPNPYSSTGGGGAGGAGGTQTISGSTITKAGNGGIGKQINITGVNLYYAGGGGGGTVAGGTAAVGDGGLGGGGAGSKTGKGTSATSGTANTGGGGGAGGFGTQPIIDDNSSGGSGGSGVVIIRYNKTRILEEQARIQREQTTITSELIDTSPVLTEDQEFNKNNRAYEYIHKYDTNYLNLNSITANQEGEDGFSLFKKENSGIKYGFSSSNSASNNPTNLFNNLLPSKINEIQSSFASNRYNSEGYFLTNIYGTGNSNFPNVLGGPTNAGDFVIIEFPEPFKLKKYSFISKNIENAPASWIIYAGNENIFNEIERKTATKNDYNGTKEKPENTYVSFLLNNEISTKKYLIVFKKTFGGNTLNFGQIKLEEGIEANIQSTSPSSFPQDNNYIQ
jgi:hypothetical protein